ncbi:hypothetical protein CDAR_124631 [Caerostris darwini]|uniref:Uncharacterized protein n=1 Tax=Caerostris darwini TaxID=1538125 RepID=A0AAV4RI62_9ARAC|nr:hypothetical protein CDAR_124631 [Caerostris darwini]
MCPPGVVRLVIREGPTPRAESCNNLQIRQPPEMNQGEKERRRTFLIRTPNDIAFAVEVEVIKSGGGTVQHSQYCVPRRYLQAGFQTVY